MVRSAESALERAAALRLNMDRSRKARWQVKAILNGGEEAIRALLGDKMDTSEELPWPNMLASGLNHLAQKVGHRPDPRVHPPVTTQNEKPRERAEKRQRIVEGYDEADRMELQLPQVGRWLPGYGFAVWTITSRVTPDGYLYPQAQLRDPFDAFPGEWGVDQQPDELAIHRVIPPLEAERLYPEHAELIRGVGLGKYSHDTRTGGIVLGGSWENPSGRGLALVEYYDRDGCHILLPDISKRVDFYPNPLRSGPPFVVAKRFSFDRLNGQYDHVIGLMASIAKINIMSVIAMQDAVFAPTNIYGDLDGQYRTGRFAVNRFPPGTKVERPQQNLPYQLFEQVNRIERQFRIVAGYPVTDDGQSPINFATGAGIDELNTAVSLEVREYQKVLQWALQDLDAKRLEWDEAVSPNRRKPIIVGESADDTAVADQYTPAKDIKGQYRCVSPDARVLTSDLRWVRAGDLQVDDELVAFDEELNHGQGKVTPMCAARVQHAGRAVLNSVKVVTDRGETVVSADHPFVVCHNMRRSYFKPDNPPNREWRKASDLTVGDLLLWMIEPWETLDSRAAGYIAGIFDGEGSVDRQRISFAQKPGAVLDETTLMLKELGFDVAHYENGNGVITAKILGGRYQTMRLIGQTRPPRMLAKSRRLWEGRGFTSKGGRGAEVLAIEPLGFQEVVTLQTSTRTFIADGFAGHNTERIYGVLAGWDDSAKIVGGLQLKQGKIIDRLTLQENLHGLRNLSEINERIADEEARETLLAVVTNMAQQGDPRAIDMLLAVLPEGDEKDRLVEALAPAEQPAEDPMAALMAATGGAGGGPPPDVTTVLSGLTGAGQPEGGVRTVGRLGAA